MYTMMISNTALVSDFLKTQKCLVVKSMAVKVHASKQ